MLQKDIIYRLELQKATLLDSISDIDDIITLIKLQESRAESPAVDPASFVPIQPWPENPHDRNILKRELLAIGHARALAWFQDRTLYRNSQKKK